MRMCHMSGRMVSVASVVGLALLVGVGCSKSVQTDTGSKAFDAGPPKAAQESGAAAGRQAPAESAAKEQFGSLPGDGSNGREAGKKSGDERVAEGVAVAKADSSESVRQQMERLQQEQAATAKAGLADVFFAYDSWKLTEEGKQALAKDAEWLRANDAPKLAVEGHCDERGTQAYNLVLGQKRAKTVFSYLVELGVPAARITVVSYGKDRPFCKESSEACYQQNRRGHLVIHEK